jgi:carboxylesterase
MSNSSGSQDHVMPGAEAWSAPGGPAGALVIHGFTGNPQSMRGLAEAFAAAGFSTELPRLPGHGTSVSDMAGTTWNDWSEAVEAVYLDLARRCERVVVAGLSMGGTLALWLASHHAEVAGVVAVNAAVGMGDAQMRQGLEELLAQGVETVPGIGSDIADPDSHELAYPEVPVRALVSLVQATSELDLKAITSPVLILNSPQDHVVPPSASQIIASGVSGPVERVSLERSFHVATLDYDRDLIEARAVDFARQVCAG